MNIKLCFSAGLWRNYGVAVVIIVMMIMGTPIVVRAQFALGYDHVSFAGAAVARPAFSFALGGNTAGLIASDRRWGTNSGRISVRSDGNDTWHNRVDLSGLQSFGLWELSESAVGFQRRNRHSGWGLETGYLGFDLFREWSVRGGLAVRFGDSATGLSLGGYGTQIPGYGQAWVVLAGGGFLHRISERVTMGSQITTLPVISGGSYRHGVRAESAGGVAVQLHNRLSVMGAAFVSSDYLKGWSVAAEIIPLSLYRTSEIRLASGYRSDSQEWSGGFLLQTHDWHSTFNFRIHPVLGWSRGIGFGIGW